MYVIGCKPFYYCQFQVHGLGVNALSFPNKGSDLHGSQLRGFEESNIECARRLFKAISDNGYIYDVAKDYKSLYDIVTK